MHKVKKKKKTKKNKLSGFRVNGVFHAAATTKTLKENAFSAVQSCSMFSLWNTILLQTILSKSLLTE